MHFASCLLLLGDTAPASACICLTLQVPFLSVRGFYYLLSSVNCISLNTYPNTYYEKTENNACWAHTGEIPKSRLKLQFEGVQFPQRMPDPKRGPWSWGLTTTASHQFVMQCHRPGLGCSHSEGTDLINRRWKTPSPLGEMLIIL